MENIADKALSMVAEGINEDTICDMLRDDLFPLDDLLTHCSVNNVPIMHHACRQGYGKLVRLLGDNNIDVNSPTSDGTPLQVASENGHADIVSYLLEHGACANTEAVWQESSPFYRATRNNHVGVLRQLYTHLQSLVIDTDVRVSLLYAACLHGQKDAVNFWYSPEISLNQPIIYVTTLTDCTEMTPLYAACVGGHDDIVAYLIELDVHLTAFICNTFPEIIGRVLVKQNYKHVGVDKEFMLAWSRLHLSTIHPLWFTLTPLNIVHLNVSHNLIKSLPPVIPWGLPHLHSLDVSHNCLTQLPTPPPDSVIPDTALIDLSVCHNHLTTIPHAYFLLASLKKLTAYNNNIASLGDDEDDREWLCVGLERLDVSFNQLTFLNDQIRRCSGLVKLNLSNNLLASLPDPWPCKLEQLNASNNHLTDFPSPPHRSWIRHLKQLYLSHNQLTYLPASITQLEWIEILDVSQNEISHLAPPSLWACRRLSKLNLGHNLLGPAKVVSPSTRTNFFTKMRPHRSRHAKGRESYSCPDIALPDFLSDCLQNLSLSDNGLTSFPQTVAKLSSLKILNLSSNGGLVCLSPSIARLTNCQLIKLSGCPIENVPGHLLEETATHALLGHMKMQLRDCQPCYRMKMLILGPKDHGKTSLVSALTNHTIVDYGSERLALYEWVIPGKVVAKKKAPVVKILKEKSQSPDITFNIWDLPGTSVFRDLEHAFYTPNAFYIVVWSLLKPMNQLTCVTDLIRNIQACCPCASVLVVATHTDKIAGSPSALLEQIKSRIQSGLSSQGSRCVLADVVGVSSVTRDGIDELTCMIYQLALSLTVSSTRDRACLMGQMVPQSHLTLQRLLTKERQERLSRRQLPLLQDADMLQFIDGIEDNDIKTAEDVTQCVKFIHEQGDIISFEDKLQGSLYILDPVWLFDLLAHVLLSPCLSAEVEKGITDKTHLLSLIPPESYPPQHSAIYLQLLERFNIALMLEENKLIVPSQIPQTKPAIVTASHSAIHRYFKLSFIPPGFWPLVITKVYISLFRYSRLSWQPSAPTVTARLLASVRITRRRSSRRILRKHVIIPWREGIEVLHSTGCIVVESAGWQTDNDAPIMPGVLITVESKDNDFAPVAFIVDELEDILLDCYKDIDLSEVFAVCSTCAEFSPDKIANPLYLGSLDHFLMSGCCLAIYNDQHLECPRWNAYLSPGDIVPELLFTDMSSKLRVHPNDLTLNTTNVLGRGHFGLVLCGQYQNRSVAVKIYPASASRIMNYIEKDADSGERTLFSIPSTHESFDQSDGETLRSHYNAASLDYHNDVLDESFRMKVQMSFSNMRREVGLLSQLHHPCIVAMVGFCIQPLCIVMELAPLGDLRCLLDSRMDPQLRDLHSLPHPSPVFAPPLSRVLTYKIIYQICQGLRYLHAEQIIYRDLKSDNVLVYSSDIDDPVNAKLSDYGISKFMTPQGMMGMCGTKGYQAPEILLSKMYDEKVDMYSLASVMYEIVSGLRPAETNTTLMDMQRTARAGILPSLKTADYTISTSLPHIETLMTRCWQYDPAQRPAAQTVATAMNDVSFLCERHDVTFPGDWQLGMVDSAVVVTASESTACTQTVWLWEGTEMVRRYHIIDIHSGTFLLTHAPCPGPQAVAAVTLRDALWLVTIANTVEVYRVNADGMTLAHSQTIGVPAEPTSVTAGAVDDTQTSVFVTTIDGRLIVISQEPNTPLGISRELQLFSGQNIKYLSVSVGSNNIWIAGGNVIKIIDKHDLVIHDTIERFFPFGNGDIECIVTDHEKVWCASDWSVVEISVESCRIMRLFEIRGDSIRGVSAASLVPFSSCPSEVDVSYAAQEKEVMKSGGVDETSDRSEMMLEKVPVAPVRAVRREGTIYNNVRGFGRANGESRSRSYSNDLAAWRRNEVGASSGDHLNHENVDCLMATSGTAHNEATKRPPIPPKRRLRKPLPLTTRQSEGEDGVLAVKSCTQIALVEDSLWVATENGKIAILDTCSGAVVALLTSACNKRNLLSVRRLVASNDDVVSLFGSEKHHEVVVWGKMGCEDVARVRGYNSAIKDLEVCMRNTNTSVTEVTDVDSDITSDINDITNDITHSRVATSAP